jgi:hypothetical protein
MNFEREVKPWVISLIAVYFTDLSDYKIRPVLIFKKLWDDYLFLPLSWNLKKEGIVVSWKDLEWGDLKKESIIIVPKCWIIYKENILKVIAKLKEEVFQEVNRMLCRSLWC